MKIIIQVLLAFFIQVIKHDLIILKMCAWTTFLEDVCIVHVAN